MPTTYAHWRFGDTALKKLPEDLQKIVEQYRDLFDLGVHGPDIFFYYDCMRHNDINRFGDKLHETSMNEILPGFRDRYETSSNKEASLAYLLGFLSHFTLDSYCHGFVDHKAEEEGPPHGKIESQYDRHLLIKDGYDPIRTKVTTSLHPSIFNAAIIAHLYGQYDEKTTYRILKDMVMYLNLLKDNTDFKRWLLQTTFRLTKTDSFADLLITREEEKSCIASNMRLDKYYDKAAEHYPLLADNLLKYLNREADLDPYFHNHFCPKEDYKDIPLFNEEDEKAYIVDFQK